MITSTLRIALPWLALALMAGAQLVSDSRGGQETSEPVAQEPALRVHYLEIVTPDRDATCELLQKVHGVTFGEPVVALGNARTARLAEGGRLGVRAPMHDAEEPVVRPYFLVDDLQGAVEKAAACGGEIAVPPMEIPGAGEFAIYFHTGNQYGLWKN